VCNIIIIINNININNLMCNDINIIINNDNNSNNNINVCNNVYEK